MVLFCIVWSGDCSLVIGFCGSFEVDVCMKALKME